MPRFRPDISELSPYVPGRRIEEVAAEIGISPERIVKLASNESPLGPFPGVAEAAAQVLSESNRYPDNDSFHLTRALAAWLGVDEANLWFGSGSVSLLSHVALAVGGPGTSAVYAWPSFVMYRIVSRWSMTETIEVPLTTDLVHDLDALAGAVRGDTTAVYVCNPNNPTGTLVTGEALRRFVERLPERVLLVVDEAYHDFVTDPRHASAASLARERPNVVVLRTFSKIFALASHRIGYGIARPETIAELRKAQAPFSVSQVAQVAAAVSLRDRGEYQARSAHNEKERARVSEAIAARGLAHSRSQANFVYFRVGEDSEAGARGFLRRGVIVRPMSGGWLRVTLGSESENDRMLEALDRLGDG